MLLGHQPRIRLSFGLHMHQPVGNSDEVATEVCDLAYLPFLRVLERHPGIRVAVHFSGSILDRFALYRPEILAVVRGLVARGQIEVVGGAYHEPILALIPESDRLDQIRALSDRLEEVFGQRPRGLWLTERAWEPHLPSAVAAAGLAWTALDDEHLQGAGLRGPQRFGTWLTEDSGAAIRILPMHTDLRLLIPNAEPEEVVAWLRDQATPDGERLAVFFDDASRFGAWPGTHAHLYEDGWLDRFFTLLETQASWIDLDLPSAHLGRLSPWGRAYIPSMGYREMASWTLPPELEPGFSRAEALLPPDLRPFLGGGFIRRFLARYPEANHLHKRMLSASRRLAEATGARPIGELPDRDLVEKARHALWRSQANEPLWHGIFGGLYLANLRDAGYRALIETDELVDMMFHGDRPFSEARIADLDLDGRPEADVRTRDMAGVVSWQGGSLVEWDIRAWKRNILDTMARHPEAYHAPLVKAEARTAAHAHGGRRGAQDLVLAHEASSGPMPRDWHRRSACLDHLLHPDTTPEQWADASWGEQGDFVVEPFDLTLEESKEATTVIARREGHVWVGQAFRPLTITKRYLWPREGSRLEILHELHNPGTETLDLWFGNSSTLSVVPGAGPEHEWLPDGTPLPVAQDGTAGPLDRITVQDSRTGRRLTLAFSEAASLWFHPVETRSQGERGLERLFQGAAILAHWRVSLAPGTSWTLKTDWSAEGPAAD